MARKITHLIFFQRVISKIAGKRTAGATHKIVDIYSKIVIYSGAIPSTCMKFATTAFAIVFYYNYVNQIQTDRVLLAKPGE